MPFPGTKFAAVNDNSMKVLHFYLLLFAVALAACTGGGDKSAKTPTDIAYENIMTRTSIRQFTDRSVSRGAVDSLLHAAMAAPTAANKQPWHFMVIDRREMLDSIAAQAPGWAPVGRAQLAILVCGNLDRTLDGEGAGFWVQDCAAVSENILLAAHAMGLGAVWCGAYPVKERTDFLNSYLLLPDAIEPMSLIAIGYPAEHPAPKNKFDSTAINYNQW